MNNNAGSGTVSESCPIAPHHIETILPPSITGEQPLYCTEAVSLHQSPEARRQPSEARPHCFMWSSHVQSFEPAPSWRPPTSLPTPRLTKSGGGRRYQCTWNGCGYVSYLPKDVRKHFVKHVRPKDEDCFKCIHPACGRLFPRSDNRDRHSKKCQRRP